MYRLILDGTSPCDGQVAKRDQPVHRRTVCTLPGTPPCHTRKLSRSPTFQLVDVPREHLWIDHAAASDSISSCDKELDCIRQNRTGLNGMYVDGNSHVTCRFGLGPSKPLSSACCCNLSFCVRMIQGTQYVSQSCDIKLTQSGL